MLYRHTVYKKPFNAIQLSGLKKINPSLHIVFQFLNINSENPEIGFVVMKPHFCGCIVGTAGHCILFFWSCVNILYALLCFPTFVSQLVFERRRHYFTTASHSYFRDDWKLWCAHQWEFCFLKWSYFSIRGVFWSRSFSYLHSDLCRLFVWKNRMCLNCPVFLKKRCTCILVSDQWLEIPLFQTAEEAVKIAQEIGELCFFNTLWLYWFKLKP